MKALNNYIMVLPTVKETQETSMGLLMTGEESSKERYKEGVVELVSDDIQTVKIGDTIVYDAVQGHDYRYNGKMYRIIQYRDVALIV
jgi:co-chaperonin GroES (HSP10)